MKKADRERFVSKVAAYIYATAVLEQGEGNVHVYLDDIEKHFGKDFFPKKWNKDIKLLIDIQAELCSYKGCLDTPDTCWLDITGYDEYGDPLVGDVCEKKHDGFDMCLFTNYIACDYDADTY